MLEILSCHQRAEQQYRCSYRHQQQQIVYWVGEDEIGMSCIEAIEPIQCDRKCQNIFLGQLKRPLVGMIMGSFIVEGPRNIELVMRSKGITNGVRSREASYPLRAFLVCVGILDRKAAREEKVSRKKQAPPIVIKHDVSGRMSRRRNDIDNSIAQIDVSDSIGPRVEAKESPHFFEVRSVETRLEKTFLADGVGFEPTKDFRPCRFSRPVPSTTRPPIRFLPVLVST